MRDSKERHRPALVVGSDEWSVFLENVKAFADQGRAPRNPRLPL
ncbi:DUF397 domain-containing protein [Sphaerisporangium album]